MREEDVVARAVGRRLGPEARAAEREVAVRVAVEVLEERLEARARVGLGAELSAERSRVLGSLPRALDLADEDPLLVRELGRLGLGRGAPLRLGRDVRARRLDRRLVRRDLKR